MHVPGLIFHTPSDHRAVSIFHPSTAVRTNGKLFLFLHRCQWSETRSG